MNEQAGSGRKGLVERTFTDIGMLQLRCFAPKAGQEDRNLTARPLHMYLLWKGLGQA